MEECMSLRDFNNAPFPDDPRALHNDPLGNSAGLESFHTIQPEDVSPNNTPKIVGAVAVALMVGVAGIALYASQGKHPAQQIAAVAPAVTEPAPAPEPAPAAMNNPDASMPATPPAAATDNSPAATAPVKEASAPKKTHKMTASIDTAKSSDVTTSKSASASAPSSAAADRMAADTNQSTVQPQQQQAIAAPTPAPSPSDLASNNITQPDAASRNPVTSDVPAQAQATQPPAPAPAQEQAAGAPQSAGQVNQ